MINSTDVEAAREYHRRRDAEVRRCSEAYRQQWLAKVRQAILNVAPRYSEIHQVYIFGSLVQPGRFRRKSDIDVAVDCEAIAVESAFWRALERKLRRDVDVRPLEGAVAEAVAGYGEKVYERQAAHTAT